MNLARISLVPAALLSLALAARAAEPQQRSISVVGTAQVHVVPDLVILSVGVETFATKIDEALAKNDERTTKTLDLAKQFDFDPKDVQTEELDLSPKYERRPGDTYEYDYDKVRGYTVSRDITFKLRDLSRLQKFVRQLLEAGTNRIHETSFTVSQPRKHRDQARELALRAAQEKATAMAGILGQKIGRPLRITEGGTGMASASSASANANRAGQVEVSEGEPPDLESGPVAPGTVTITAVVTVEFELE